MVDTMVGLMAEIFNLMEVINLPEALHHWAAQRKSPQDLASCRSGELDLTNPGCFMENHGPFFGGQKYYKVGPPFTIAFSWCK